MKNLLIISIAAIFTIVSAKAQNVAINADASLPNASAMLDIKNANKGLLIPRITLTATTDVITIPSPATSLMVYNTTAAGAGATAVTPGYYYYNGAAWVQLTTSATPATAWLLTGNAGTVDGTNFIGTTDNTPFNVRVNNLKAGRIDITSASAFWGYLAGFGNTTGLQNTAVGSSALQNNTTGNNNTANGVAALSLNTGSQNTATGSGALQNNSTANNNTAQGYNALTANTTGTGNTSFGATSLITNTTSSFNTAVGLDALQLNTGASNTAVGSGALRQNTTASNNTALGGNALNLNTTGIANTGLGTSALQNNTTGTGNTATGMNALNLNTTGNSNTATGTSSLQSNTTGSSNTADGTSALTSNTTGIGNTASGHAALQANTIGAFNTATGSNALYFNSTGLRNTATGSGALQNNSASNNTAQGYNALSNNFSGANNTAIGSLADVSSVNLSNATAIGAGATVNASNKVRIGNTSVTVIEGQVAYTFPSDKRFKYNIQRNVPGLAFIKKLTPVTYFFDTKKMDEFTKTGMLREGNAMQAGYSPAALQLHTGFLAQDVEEAANSLGYKFDGVHAPDNAKDYYSVAYSQFIMPLVKAVQEQQVIIEDQKNDLDTLKTQMAEMRKAIEELKKK